MDDHHLTYKVEEVCYEQAMKIYIGFFNDSVEKLSKAFEAIGKQIAETLTLSLEGVLASLWDFFEASEEPFKLELKRKQLRPIKSIKPTHSAPAYRIVPKVRNRLR